MRNPEFSYIKCHVAWIFKSISFIFNMTSVRLGKWDIMHSVQFLEPEIKEKRNRCFFSIP